MDKMKNTSRGKKQLQKKKMKEILQSLFYDVSKPSAYTSRRNVYQAARRLVPSITQADVDQWFEDELTYTLHKPTRIHFARNKTIVNSGKQICVTCNQKQSTMMVKHLFWHALIVFLNLFNKKQPMKLSKHWREYLTVVENRNDFSPIMEVSSQTKRYKHFFENIIFYFSQQIVNKRQVLLKDLIVHSKRECSSTLPTVTPIDT